MMNDFILGLSFVAGFMVLWIGILHFAAYLGGWSKFARIYPVEALHDGPTFHFQSASLGSANYSGCLTFRVCQSGLAVATLLPFRFGHPPLFIPWTAFESFREKRFLFMRYVEARIGERPVAKFYLPLCIRDHVPAERFIA